MTADDDRTLDPDRVATRGFSTSFRGFDTEEVRRFLEELASALRAQREEVPAVTARPPNVERISSERDGLAKRILDLEGQLRRMGEEAEALQEEAAKPRVEPQVQQEFDEASATELLGKETVRVLDTAREAAREIVNKAETTAAERTQELDEREAKTAADIEERLTKAKDEAATRLRSAEEEAERLTSEATSSAIAVTTSAKDDAATARKAAVDEATEVRSQAKEEAVRLVAQAETEAATAKAEAEEAASQLRATAEADASASQDSAREQARQMLNEAQAVREKVLADLVKRRRVGRQQLDQVKAARDRLARSLAVVRKDLDEAMGEVVAAVPDARAAMEAVGRRIPESSDNRQAAELAAELDSRSAGSLPGLPDEEEPEELPDIDELFARIKSGDEIEAESTPEAVKAEPKRSEAKTPEPQKPEPKKAEAKKAEPKKAEAKPVENKKSSSTKPADEKIDSKPAESEAPKSGPAVRSSKTPPKTDRGPAAVVSSATATAVVDAPPDTVADGDADESVEPAAPEVFLARDVALTRFGPDLRRKLKRALADDQSQILDGLRQVKGAPQVADLPSADRQVGSYADVLSTALNSAADAGAGYLGKSAPKGLLDDLVADLAKEIIDPLRQKVERVVSSAEDKAEAIEPIRAQYREVRSNQLPDLVDDALADAFALGLFEVIADGSNVQWVADPRVEAGPDCHDNTLAGVLTKPDAFPTGRSCPPGSPGCRCLVTPAD